jgi:hypothetical protein
VGGGEFDRGLTQGKSGVVRPVERWRKEAEKGWRVNVGSLGAAEYTYTGTQIRERI